MNSASVAGGAPPEPEHLSTPPQSPVSHLPLPETSKEHPRRPQNRPDHPAGALIVTISPGLSWNPPLMSWGFPAPGWIPGHIMSLHLFSKVKTAASVPEKESYQSKHVIKSEKERDLWLVPMKKHKSRSKNRKNSMEAAKWKLGRVVFKGNFLTLKL